MNGDPWICLRAGLVSIPGRDRTQFGDDAEIGEIAKAGAGLKISLVQTDIQASMGRLGQTSRGARGFEDDIGLTAQGKELIHVACSCVIPPLGKSVGLRILDLGLDTTTATG